MKDLVELAKVQHLYHYMVSYNIKVDTYTVRIYVDTYLVYLFSFIGYTIDISV